MAISKIIFNGVVQMDVTGNTSEAGNMLDDVIGTGADGTEVTGTIETVTHPDPSISVNSSTGLITASHTQSAGYVASSGTTTATSQLSTQAAATITPSTSQQTAVAAGKYTTGAVVVSAMPSGTAGTPTASKGTVSNHSISVTPSVTNTTGYITGGTKTGTAVTVSASELVSGNKEITSNGTGIDVADYSTVSVAVPSFSPTLITKSITQNGTYNASSDNADGYSSVEVSVSGGGVTPAPKKQINFIDYDGTILYSYTKAEINAMTSGSDLPANPSHTGLTAQGWNWTLAQIKAQLTAMPDADVWVGQMYITSSGKTEIDVSFPDSARLSPTMTIAVNGTVTVDWGDNTAADTVTGSSLTTRQAVPHTYASTGDYTIKITVSSGSFTFYGSSVYTLLRKNTTSNENTVYANTIQAVRLGSGVTSIGNYAFYGCCSLASVTIPSGVTSIGTYAFNNCYSLASVTIPSEVTSIGNNAFYYCYSLASVTIPSGVTSIGTYAFNNCYSLVSITIPSGVTSIGTYAFNNCSSLASVTIPSGVTSIGDNAFQNCYGVKEYHIKPTSVPTAGTTIFKNIVSDCVIYVPSAKLSDYQTAWSAYSSYLQGE